MRAAPRRGVRVHHRFVDQIRLHAAAEHFVAQIERADLLVLLIDDVYSHGSYFLPFFFTGSTWATLSFLAAIALRITTTAFGPPGTRPLDEQQIVLGIDPQHLQVAHRHPVGPHVPAHPHARARRATGYDEAPIEPGAR